MRRIQDLVKEQEVLKKEVDDALECVQDEIVDFIHTQKEIIKEPLIQVKQQAQALEQVTTQLEVHVDSVKESHKQLEEVGQHILTTVDELAVQTTQWNKALQSNQEVTTTLNSTTQDLSVLVDEIGVSHKVFDATVNQLHDAVVQLGTPVDEVEETKEVLIDMSPYVEHAQKADEDLKKFDEEREKSKEKAIKETDLLIEESFLAEQHASIHATNDLLSQLETRRAEAAKHRLDHQEEVHRLLGASATRPSSPVLSYTDNELLNRHSAQLALIDTVEKSNRARQERIEGFNKSAHKNPEEMALQEHHLLVSSLEEALKARAEQRQVRMARVQSVYRFFDESTAVAADDTDGASLNIQLISSR